MKTIFISGAHGSGCSIVKSLLTGVKILDNEKGTCHESWNHGQTVNQDRVFFYHFFSRTDIVKMCDPDIVIWIYINEKNLLQICQRIVVLDFLYTNDKVWIEKDWCWTQRKHETLAGPDWPSYSKNIFDYPTWCLNEMCQVAYERCLPWTKVGPGADYIVDSNELFTDNQGSSLETILNDLKCPLDKSFLAAWQNKNKAIQDRYQDLFTWTPNWAKENNWQAINFKNIQYD